MPGSVIIENRNDITAFDDPAFTKEFSRKAIFATQTACNVFDLLKRFGAPVAFDRQLSETEFLAPACQMIPLEVVARRFAVGSFLKRCPGFQTAEGLPPFKFEKPKIEFFLKTTGGKFVRPDGEILIQGLDPLKGEEDPWIFEPHVSVWNLFHSKKPINETVEKMALLGMVQRDDILPPGFTDAVPRMTEILSTVFLILETAFFRQKCRLIDMKVEFGVSSAQKLLIADVIDNDSWRLRDWKWQELSKEKFRQGDEMSEVERAYAAVAEETESFKQIDPKRFSDLVFKSAP